MEQEPPPHPTPRTERHTSTKRTLSVSRGSAAYPRKRAVIACQVCRSRRTKCDQKKPTCSFCESIGAACISDPGTQSTFDPASIAIIERLDKLQRKLDLVAEQSPQTRTEQIVPSSVERPAREFLPQNFDSIIQWPIFQGLDLSTSSLWDHCSPASVESSSSSISVSDELNLAACNEWLNAFFKHCHCKNPVLDEQNTRRLVRRICQEGLGWDAESCLALLVCANGALARPLLSESVSSLGVNSIPMALYLAGMKRIGSALGSAGAPQAQCFFFAGVFLMSILRPYDAWRMFLQALSMCQRITYRSQPDGLETKEGTRPSSIEEAEESIYWSTWKSEREVRWELGLPDFRETGLDAPRTFPNCPEDCEGDRLQAWYFYLSEISLWRLETAATNEVKTVVANEPGKIFETLAEVADEKLQQVLAWQTSLPPNLSFTAESNHDDDILRFVLQGRTTYFHELISWPFIYAAVNNNDDTEIVSKWARMGFAFHLERIDINRPGFYHRHHGTWLMIRSSARSALILLAGARNPSTLDMLPPTWRAAVEDTLTMIHFWANTKEEHCTLQSLKQVWSNTCNYNSSMGPIRT